MIFNTWPRKALVSNLGTVENPTLKDIIFLMGEGLTPKMSSILTPFTQSQLSSPINLPALDFPPSLWSVTHCNPLASYCNLNYPFSWHLRLCFSFPNHLFPSFSASKPYFRYCNVSVSWSSCTSCRLCHEPCPLPLSSAVVPTSLKGQPGHMSLATVSLLCSVHIAFTPLKPISFCMIHPHPSCSVSPH